MKLEGGFEKIFNDFKQGSENQLRYSQLILDAELAKKDELIKELSAKTNRQRAELADVKIPLERKIIVQRNQIQKLTFECANLQKQLDESMASYYKAEDRAEVAIGAYNTCYDRELNLKAEIDGYAKMNQSLVRDCCDLTDEVAELKQFDIRQWIPVGERCLPDFQDDCRFCCTALSGANYCSWDKKHTHLDTNRFSHIVKLESCPKPDKGEVKT
jgi:hypothetical protein